MYSPVFVTSFLLFAGSVYGEQDRSNQAFNQSLAVLAQANGISLSYDVTVVALISQVTNISSTGVADIMQGLGAFVKLVSYLNTTTVSQTTEQFCGINQVYNNFTVSAYNMSIMLVKLDSKQTTQVKVGLLKAAVSTTEEAIARIANVSREALLNLHFLTEFNPRLPSIADQITMNSTMKLIADSGLTDQRFEAITGVNVTHFNHLRALRVVALVRENTALAEKLNVMVNDILVPARNTFIQTFLFNMSMVRRDCIGKVSDFNNTPISVIYSDCLGFDFSGAAAVLSIKDKERRELLARLTPAEMREISRLSSATMFDAIGVGKFVVLVDMRLRPILRPLGVAISVESYRAGIAFANLSSYLLIDWATTVAQVSDSILYKIFNLSRAGANTLKTTKFSGVPELVWLYLRTVYPQNLFFTVSFQGLVRILVTEKTQAVAREEFMRGITYFATTLRLKEIQAMYGVCYTHFLSLTLLGLSQTYAGITPDQLRTVFYFTKEEAEKLRRVSIEDAGIILDQAAVILRRTPMEIGREIISTGSETDVLYDDSRGVLMKAGRADLIKTATVFDIIVTFGQVDLAAYQKLLAGLGASTTLSAVIKANPQMSFAASLNLSVDAVSKTPLLTFLKSLKRRWDKEPRVCSVVTHECGSHARCWSSYGGSFTCRCFVGYTRYEGKCEKRKGGTNYVLIGLLVGLSVIGWPLLALLLYLAKKGHSSYQGTMRFTKANGGDAGGSSDGGI